MGLRQAVGVAILLAVAGCGTAREGDVPSAVGESIPPPIVTSMDGPATLDPYPNTRPADRYEPRDVDTACDDITAAAVVDRHGAGQYIIVQSSSWESTAANVDVVIAEPDAQSGGIVTTCQRGQQAAMVGRTGMRPILGRRSGDGTTPAGYFPLGVVTAWDGEVFSFFGNSPNPGVRGSYRGVQRGDCWGATPGASTYNKLYRRVGCPGPDDEYLPNITGAYSHAAVIGANLGADISGDAPGEVPYAAAIFLHRHAFDASGAPKPTSGCVSLSLGDLVATLALIEPEARPQFFIGTTEWLRSNGTRGN
jgi:L,D-peptidoglycan transpeptidase YkuD (ErfK/YbiS/YcfS/YnhG family)